jgi:hypothetical protein
MMAFFFERVRAQACQIDRARGSGSRPALLAASVPAALRRLLISGLALALFFTDHISF